MKKIIQKLIPIVSILAVAGIVFVPQMAMAQIPFIGGIAQSAIVGLLANISNQILAFTAILVTISGIFLSVSINLTTNIQNLLTQVTAIQAVWLTIRDISSIFIIFALLYFSIKTILGSSTSGLNQLIVKIFLAGLFINFSLFFVKVGVDASNLVSLQFYNAISPGTSQNMNISDTFSKGGLSNVFMQNLRIPLVYQNSSTLSVTSGSSPTTTSGQIFFAALGGIIIMITAAISFFAAAIAFTARTGILLFVMAMSPIYFVGLIFPEVKREISDKIKNVFVSQLVFMPAYLFFMYIALKVISDPHFMSVFNPPGAAPNTSFAYVWSGIIIQYVIAIFFINLPLVVALKLGASGMSWAPDGLAVSKWFGNKAKNAGTFAAQHTVGRSARFAGGKLASSDFAAANPNLAVLANKGITKVSGASFGGTKGGYDKRFKDYSKTRTEYATKTLATTTGDKARVTTITDGKLREWDQETAQMREDIEYQSNLYQDAVASEGAGSERAKSAAKKRDDLIDKLEKRDPSARKAYEEKSKGDIEKAVKKERVEEFAKNMSESFNPITKKARQDAADTIRKGLKGNKKDTVLKEILDLASEEKGGEKEGEGKEEKPEKK